MLFQNKSIAGRPLPQFLAKARPQPLGIVRIQLDATANAIFQHDLAEKSARLDADAMDVLIGYLGQPDPVRLLAKKTAEKRASWQNL